MKIALISSLFPPFAFGGAEKIAAELARNLFLFGHQVDVISTCRSGDLNGHRFRKDVWEGITVWRIAPRNLYWSFDRQTLKPNRITRAGWHLIDLWNPSVARPLAEVLDQIAPDIVNTHNIDGLSPLVWRVAKQYTDAIVHSLHDHHLVCLRATMAKRDGRLCDRPCGSCSIYAKYHQLFQSHVGTLVAPARPIANMHREMGWRSPKMVLIQHGVDIGNLYRSQVRHEGPLRVSFISRLEREKGCETLLAIIERFQGSADIEFNVAGTGSYQPRFEELSQKSSKVIWHGFLNEDQKPRLLSETDVFLQLSECHEASSLAVIEAKRNGVYVIGTNIGGIPELIESGEVGQLFAPGDREELFRMLSRSIAQRSSIRANREARFRGVKPYGTREMAEAYLEVFASLLKSVDPERNSSGLIAGVAE